MRDDGWRWGWGRQGNGLCQRPLSQVTLSPFTQMKNTTLFLLRLLILFIYSFTNFQSLFFKINICFSLLMQFFLLKFVRYLQSVGKWRVCIWQDICWLHLPMNDNKKGTIQFTLWLDIFRLFIGAFPNICFRYDVFCVAFCTDCITLVQSQIFLDINSITRRMFLELVKICLVVNTESIEHRQCFYFVHLYETPPFSKSRICDYITL